MRVYDPHRARFLSADPFVQAPFDAQSLNRYSYVQNNPLSFYDPTGFLRGQNGDVMPEQDTVFERVAELGTLEVLRRREPRALDSRAVELGTRNEGGGGSGDSAQDGVQGTVTVTAPPIKDTKPRIPTPRALPQQGPQFENWQILLPFTMLFTLEEYYTGQLPENLQTPVELGSMIVGLGKIKAAAKVAANAARAGATGVGRHAGESIAARSSGRNFTAAERARINEIGSRTGCHTCGTTNPRTRSGNFVPDHQPPSALNPTGGPQRLYPQCINCSREQGLEIARQLQQGGR